jgi:tetratricopeptide (TPR) repeat protein
VKVEPPKEPVVRDEPKPSPAQAPPPREEAKPKVVPQDVAEAPPAPKAQTKEQPSSYDNEKHAHELFVHAEKAYELQDYWQAIQLCRQAVEVRDDVAKYHYVLGLALLRNKKWRKEAAESLQAASKLEPSNPQYLGMLGALYETEGLHLRAQKIIQQVKRIDASYEIPELPL